MTFDQGHDLNFPFLRRSPPEVMLRTLIAAVLVVAGTVYDTPSSDAQGILGRIRARAAARRAQPYRPQPPRPSVSGSFRNPNPSTLRPANPNYPGLASGSTTLRRAPVSADTPVRPANPTLAPPRYRAAESLGAAGVNTDSNSEGSESTPPSVLDAADAETVDRSAASGRNGRPQLGIDVAELPAGGLRVMSIRRTADGRSGEAGSTLKIGDVIEQLDGRPIDSISKAGQLIATRSVGDTLEAVVRRDDRRLELNLPVLGDDDLTPSPLPSPLTDGRASPRYDREQLGIETRSRPGVRGVRVTGVADGSPAASAGLRTDDRLFSIDGQLVTTEDRLDDLLTLAAGDETIELQWVREDRVLRRQAPAVRRVSWEVDPLDGGEPKTQPASGLAGVLGGFFGGGTAATSTVGEAAEQTGARDTNDDRDVASTRTSPDREPSRSSDGPLFAVPGETTGSAAATEAAGPTDPVRPAASPSSNPVPESSVDPEPNAEPIEDDMAFGDEPLP